MISLYVFHYSLQLRAAILLTQNYPWQPLNSRSVQRMVSNERLSCFGCLLQTTTAGHGWSPMAVAAAGARTSLRPSAVLHHHHDSPSLQYQHAACLRHHETDREGDSITYLCPMRRESKPLAMDKTGAQGSSIIPLFFSFHSFFSQL
jgi:hypothetical protein